MENIMKKVALLIALVISTFTLVPAIQANTADPQVRVYTEQDRHQKRNRGRKWNNRRRVIVRNEHRYVRLYGNVYREIYRSTYLRNGRLVRRTLLSRQRVRHQSDNNFRFNVFLNF